MTRRRTYDGCPGITAAFFDGRRRVSGDYGPRDRRGRFYTDDDVRALVRDELARILDLVDGEQ